MNVLLAGIVFILCSPVLLVTAVVNRVQRRRSRKRKACR